LLKQLKEFTHTKPLFQLTFLAQHASGAVKGKNADEQDSISGKDHVDQSIEVNTKHDFSRNWETT
jgi:hypothetical protein